MSLQKHAYFALLALILLGSGLTWTLFNISQHPQPNILEHVYPHVTPHEKQLISNSNLSTTSQLDIFKYKSTNTTICDVWERSNILVGSHHKTGSILLVSAITQRTFERYLKSICYHKNTTPLKYTLYGINKRKRIHIDMGINGLIVNKFYIQSLKTINKTKNNNYSYHFVAMNIVRDPTDTVLSEYNYDKKCGESPAINKIINLNRYIKPVIINNYIPLIQPVLNMTQKEIINKYSLQMLWNKYLSVEYGIIGAWLLYKHIYYPHVVSSYGRIKYYINLEKENTYFHFHNFKLDTDFGTNFTKTCGMYLDKMGIIDEYHRNKLMKMFRKHDMKHRRKTKHATNGRYNKTAQYELLLKSEKRCKELKEMTIKLDYEWRFTQKC